MILDDGETTILEPLEEGEAQPGDDFRVNYADYTELPDEKAEADDEDVDPDEDADFD